jgi:DNA-binding MarR family transcriptional regulator
VGKGSDDLEALAAELDAHWVEIGRFFLSRKLRDDLRRGGPRELSPVQRHTLALLGEEPMRIRDLAERLGLAESSATRLADRLEALGLARRRADAEDRRSVLLQLTPSGRAHARAVAKRRRAYLVELLRRLEPEERRELVRLFAKIAGAAPQRTGATADRRAGG